MLAISSLLDIEEKTILRLFKKVHIVLLFPEISNATVLNSSAKDYRNQMGVKVIPTVDLDFILQRTRNLWEPLKKKNIFLTGGTGFIGKWLIESFLHINEKIDLGATIYVLSRKPQKFLKDHPWLINRNDLCFLEGDVRNFIFPPGIFTHIIHGATSVADPDQSIETFDTVVRGTWHTLEFAKQANTKNFLLLSSGAIYGKHPETPKLIPETFSGAPPTNQSQSAYGEGKRAAEWLTFEYGNAYGINACAARCYALVGPYLPLDKHFAMGNFIRDAMAGSPINISGDGTPMRSYLYASDLSIWLWTILLKGKNGQGYNVGSDESISIKNLATLISSLTPSHPDVLLSQKPKEGVSPERYVPDINKARNDLGLDNWTSIEIGIKKTMDWIKNG